MGLGPSSQQQAFVSQHEADLASVERLLARDGGPGLDAGTTMMLLWKCRRDPRHVAAAASWLEKQSDARHAFDGVELYLPQLAHMLVHLDVDWPAGTLERFCLVVAQQSPHFALQLHWILRSAMEDYAPAADGSGGHELYYRRCAHLDEDVESVVAHGSARPQELEELYARGAIGRDELGDRSRTESRSLAKRLVEGALRPMLRAVEGGTEVSLVDPTFVPHRKPSYEGALRWRRESSSEVAAKHPKKCASLGTCCGLAHSRPRWVSGWGKIEGRSLLVYVGSPTPRLVRALPLDGATVTATTTTWAASTTRGFEFVVAPREASSFAPARLRAVTEAARTKWVEHLTAESTRDPRAPPPAEHDVEASPRRLRADALARRRYDMFERERQFAEDLVGVAETLRALPRDRRQRELARCLRAVAVPRLAYLPLCNSTDKWRTVLAVVSDEGSVFNTKERCPCLIYFETAYEKGLEGLDVANVVHAYVAQDKIDDARVYDDDDTAAAEESGCGDLVPRDRRDSDEGKYSVRESAANSYDTVDDLLPRNAEEEEEEEEEDERREESKVPPATATTTTPATTTTTTTPTRSSWRRSPPSTPPTSMSKTTLAKAIERARTAAVSIWRPDDQRPAVQQTTTISPLQPAQEAASPPHPHGLSAQAERIHERATRVLEFWREQLQSAISYDGGPAPRQRSESADRIDSGPRRAAERHPSYGEGFGEKETKIRAKSHLARLEPSWALRAVIVKSNDDLRQEVFIVQLISRYAALFAARKLPLYLRPYRIVALSASTGLVELVPDSTSLDKLYAKPGFPGLKAHFVEVHGEEGSEHFEKARSNFIQSAAAAAFITYVLAIKDRHNGNLLLTASGRLVHIDFGFCLGHATGGAFSLEQFAPFKLTKDMAALMGARGMRLFADAFADACVASRANLEEVSTLIEIMQFKSRLPCFRAQKNKDVVKNFKARHFLHLSDAQLRAKAASLVHQSLNNTGTYLYDVFQNKTNGIAF
ncbi:hypothetical protein CTAYLR_000435 [Chrysophaeum taylorii]|uniref:Phosphatidylinositol 4-kinase n=1 Tax=Chrysophaeum taylorii TaxID=2483200 RepID=A0AAD7UFX0_9STRA|nr:hypothetical protein CTAYLR_000435 [Chrysophaeum taylorii]